MSQDSLKGSLLADKTPYSNDGTIYGATFATDRMGQPNKAMSFDGVDDYVDCGNDESLNLRNRLTVNLWVKRNVLNTQQTIAQHWYGINQPDQRQWFLDFRGTGNNKIHGYLNDGLDHEFVGNTDIDTNYHMITLSYDKSYIRIYLDGIEDMMPISLSSTLRNSTTETIIGYSKRNPNFKGSIDDVRIYNRALSEDEIKTLYNSYNSKIIL